MNQVKQQADACEHTLRISIDAKAKINIGCFSRGGYNRVSVEAADHDFKSEVELVPFGVFLPNTDDLFLYFTPSKVTADFIVDTLEQWWEEVKSDFPQVKTLVIHLDNGPENNSHRTQFIKRIVVFAQKYQLRVRLAYYPPYHSNWTLDKMNGFWGRKRENGKTRKRDRERNWTLPRSQQWQIGSITRYFERNRFLLKPPNNYPASCLRHQKTAES